MQNYLSFLKKYQTLFGKYCDFDPYLEQLLNAIAIYNEEHSMPLRCTELLKRYELGSPATIHKNMMYLIELGFLEHTLHPTDKRIRYVELSKKGKIFFEKCEELLKICK